MTDRDDPDPVEREQLTEQDLAIATLVGRYVERRERGEAPCAHDLLAVAAEFGDDRRRRSCAPCSPSTRRCARARTAPADGPTRHPRVARPGGRAGGGGSARQRGGPPSHRRTRWPPPSTRPGARSRSSEIRVPENVRALDDAHVKALAGSIALQGMLVPVVVRDDGDGFELVAGFHRIAAARSLGLAEVPVVVRDAETEDADRAVENITRKQLNPYEEAKAVQAMLDRGLTEDGAAQALGWPKTPRHRAREDPRAARARPAADRRGRHPPGRRRPAARDRHGRARRCSTPSSPTSTTATPGPPSGSRASPAGCSTPRCTHAGNGKVFAAYLHSASAHEIAELRLGKKTEQLYARRREAAQAARPLRLRAAAGPLHRRRRRPGARRRRADRVRARPADHRRPPALPRARQGRDQAHPRRARGQGRGGRARRRRPRARARRRPTR